MRVATLDANAKILAASKGRAYSFNRSQIITDDEFVILISKQQELLYKIAFHYLRNEHDALEMFSETVFKAYRSRKTLKNKEFFNTWITRILINSCLNNIKRNKHTVSLDDDILENTEDNNRLSIEDGILVEKALSRLKDEYRTVLLLRYFQGFSIKETAMVLSIPENTVKTHTDRALKQLRKILKEDEFNDLY